MKLQTTVELPAYPFQLNHRSDMLLMGSCFTEHIGGFLERYLFKLLMNPFGITYNPLSIRDSLDTLMQKQKYQLEDLEKHGNKWFSFGHSTLFSSSDQEQSLKAINASFLSAKARLENLDYLILTWGTSWIYRFRETGQVVNNCHKIPARAFERERLSPKDIITAYEALIPELLQFNPGLRIILTISPVRHWKDGAHGNQLSKASLLLAMDALRKSLPEKLFYFLAYEIVLDELRDYRFYAADMLHTNDLCSTYIWEKFSHCFFSQATRNINQEVGKVRKLQEHRPLGADSESLNQLQRQQEDSYRELKEKYPDLEWDRWEYC